MLHAFQRIESIHEIQILSFFFFVVIIINSLICNALILKWRFYIQEIHIRYIEHKYTFLHKVVSKEIVFTHAYLMVFVPTVNDASCKTKLWDALMLQKRSVQAEVLFSF